MSEPNLYQRDIAGNMMGLHLIEVTARAQSFYPTPSPQPAPYVPAVLTDYDVARIVRAVIQVLDERERPSVLDVTPADVRRYLGSTP